MKNKLNKKGMELPINILVMLILGIVLFVLGLSVFSQIFDSSEKRIEELNNRIAIGIGELECENDISSICSPSNTMRRGQTKTFLVYYTNHKDVSIQSNLKINDETSSQIELTNDCGKLEITAPNIQVSIPAKESASFPFTVSSRHVQNTPCSFVTTAEIYGERTSLIIRVE